MHVFGTLVTQNAAYFYEVVPEIAPFRWTQGAIIVRIGLKAVSQGGTEAAFRASIPGVALTPGVYQLRTVDTFKAEGQRSRFAFSAFPRDFPKFAPGG